MRRFFRYMLPILGLTAAIPVFSVAQTDNVGIGTASPERSAMLDIASPGSPKKGLLIPSMNYIQRNAMEAAYNDTLPPGLLIYETDSGNFWYYKWTEPFPVGPGPYGNWVKISTQQSSNAAMPQGGIIMWSGTIASIPAGWALCNGANGTPDLTDKFIVSVTSAAENPGTAAVPNQFVTVSGTQAGNDRRFFKLAYIMKL